MQDLEFRQFIERVKLRLPIEGVVGDRVSDLRKRGALYWARCPFHEERTPSFAVDPRRGSWHCYGACGEGGDAISFVQRFDGVDFMDALRLLAQSAGEEMPELKKRRQRTPGEEAREEGRYDVLRRAARLYQKSLAGAGGAHAMAYMRGRGFEPETIEAFGVGFAPEEGDPVLTGARRAGVDEALLVETGLVRRTEGGRAYDFFRARLMIPIHDRLSRVVGFGGRALSAEARAKYVNTAETELFHKGRLVYGLDRAAAGIREARAVVLVEGYTDVMAAHQVGLTHVVAVLGTATTPEHAGLLRRAGARKVVLLFDGDEAGRRASRRALPALFGRDFEITIVSPPAGQDPADFLLAEEGGGREAFEELIASAKDWFAWTLDGLAGLQGAELATEIDGVFETLAALDRPVEEELRIRELADRLGLPEERMREAWRRFRQRRRPERRPENRPQRTEPVQRDSAPAGAMPAAEIQQDQVDVAPPREVAPGVRRAFAGLIGALLCDNSLIPAYSDRAAEAPAELGEIFAAILDLYENGDEELEIDAAAVMAALGDRPSRDRVAAIEELARTAESPMALARGQVEWLDRHQRSEELSRLATRLQDQPTFEAEDAAKEVLSQLHRELCRDRVPTGGSDPTL